MSWDESKHLRDDDGRFTDGTGKTYRQNASYADIVADGKAPTQAEQKRMEELGYAKKKVVSFDEFFGEEFTGVKGAEAVEKLLKEQRGHVKNAFERPEVGGITLVWGNEKGGLRHAIFRRDKMLQRGTGHISGLDIAKLIPNIMEKGEFSIDEYDRPRFELDGYRVAIKPSYFDKKLNWIVSAIEIV